VPFEPESLVMLMKMKGPMTVIVAVVVLAACTVNPYTREEQPAKAAIGAGIGVLAGAGIGLLTGDNAKERRRNALIGAGVGGVAGGGIGYYMDVQEAKLRQELESAGVSVTRNGNNILLNMEQAINFDSGRHELRGGSYSVLNAVGKVLSEYEKTTVDVMGHTDSDGEFDYNQNLSESRAVSVADYLSARGVNEQRLLAAGYGEASPIASNNTSSGKQRNRRVEIRISPLTY
jgi:outer membrane protein OmpA-like peptidoglycan-associated protein